MSKLWKWFTGLLDRVPSAWGIPAMVIAGALIWLGVLKLFGL